MKAYLNVNFILASRTGLQWPPGARHYFWCMNRNPDLKKKNFDIYEDLLKCDLPTCAWLASRISLQQPLGAKYHF